MSVITADYTHKSFIIKTSSPQTELNSHPMLQTTTMICHMM